MSSDPTLAELGIPEKIAGHLAAADIKTLSAIEAEREAHESLVHVDGIGEVYDVDVAEAIEAWREMAVDAEPGANDAEPAQAPAAEQPAEVPAAEQPAEVPAAEQPVPGPRSPVPSPQPSAPKPIDLLRHEAANLSVLEEAAKLLTDSIQEALEDFYRDRPAESAPGKGKLLRIVLRREMVIGEAPQTIGTPLAVVQLEPGISLNFLVDAVRNGLAAAK